MKKSAFPTEEAYREAKMEEVDRISLKEEIVRFQQQLHSLREAVLELHKMLEGKE